MKGYQFLENDFFELCQTREIGHTPMLLYIYLRGLFCRFQKPIFTWQDKQTRSHLAISHLMAEKHGFLRSGLHGLNEMEADLSRLKYSNTIGARRTNWLEYNQIRE